MKDMHAILSRPMNMFVNICRQMLPLSLQEKALGKDNGYYDNALGDGKPVVVYFHGNSATRYE